MTAVQPLFNERLKPRTERLIGTYVQIQNVGQRSKGQEFYPHDTISTRTDGVFSEYMARGDYEGI